MDGATTDWTTGSMRSSLEVDDDMSVLGAGVRAGQ